MTLLRRQKEIEKIAEGETTVYLLRSYYLEKFRKEKIISKKDYKRIKRFLSAVVAINSLDEMIVEHFIGDFRRD